MNKREKVAHVVAHMCYGLAWGSASVAFWILGVESAALASLAGVVGAIIGVGRE